MSEITRTFDKEFITQCVTESGNWRAMKDDSEADPLLFFPPVHEGIFWLRAGDYGVFMLHQHNLITYEAHTILLPIAKGRAVALARAAAVWMFENTPCKRIITNVPSYNSLALLLAKKAGLKQYGVNIQSFQKDGILYDQTLLGISKEA